VATVRSRLQAAPPEISSDGVLFTYRDPRPRIRGVRLAHDMSGVGADTTFERVGRARLWRLWLPRPPVDRFEYQLEVFHQNHGSEWLLDPLNEARVPGVFGDKSVIEFPEYDAPGWIFAEAPQGAVESVRIPSRALRARVTADVWSSPGAEPGKPLPLLVVHDGPETAQLTQLLDFLALAVEGGALPPLRAALLHPVRRDETYSAAAAYGRALANEIVPGLEEVAPTPFRKRMRIGMGASLGALAAFHAHREHHDLFGALFLQSGSFFRRSDEHERWFGRFERIARFTAKAQRGDGADPIPVTLTVGTGEQNLDANRELAAALERQAYEVRLVENRDAHTWIGWRDTYDPHLLELLRTRWA
jgi:enterochelin esterase family protein